MSEAEVLTDAGVIHSKALRDSLSWIFLHSERWRPLLPFLLFKCVLGLVWLIRVHLVCPFNWWFAEMCLSPLVLLLLGPPNATDLNDGVTPPIFDKSNRVHCDNDMVFTWTALFMTLLLYVIAWVYQLYNRLSPASKGDDITDESISFVTIQ
jgi:hypothetical protein